jgi:hypothetical protein
MNIQKFIKIIENNSFSMDERQGQEWEKKLMYSWGPKAAINMAKVVKMSFTSLYPTVPICVKRDENFVMATTDPDADIYYLDIDYQYLNGRSKIYGYINRLIGKYS